MIIVRGNYVLTENQKHAFKVELPIKRKVRSHIIHSQAKLHMHLMPVFAELHNYKHSEDQDHSLSYKHTPFCSGQGAVLKRSGSFFLFLFALMSREHLDGSHYTK